MAVAWGLLAVLLAAVMRREPGEVRRRWRELTEASPRPGKTVDVVGPKDELLERIAMPSEEVALEKRETDAISQEWRIKVVRGIRLDATLSLVVFLLCGACAAALLMLGPLGNADIPAPSIAAGAMFLVGGIACTYLLNFYSGALELLDHDYSETYLFTKSGGIFVWAVLGTIPAAAFSLGAAGMARIDPDLTLHWSFGWATVYAATGGIHATICWRLQPNEDMSGSSRPGRRTGSGTKGGARLPAFAALVLGMPLLLPAAIQVLGIAVRMVLRCAS